MTQVSKFRLRPEVERKITDLFSGVIINFKRKDDLNNFFGEFLSPTEKIIYAKRLTVAVLLTKGNSYADIARILRVTPPTISKMSMRLKYGNGSIKNVAEKIVNSDINKALFQELLSLLDIPTKGLPISEYHKKVKKRSQKIRRLIKEI